VLFIPNYYTEDALIARQAKELGLNVPIFASDGAQTPELIQIGGPAVEGIHFIGHFHPQGAATPLAKEFIKTENIPEKTSPPFTPGADATSFYWMPWNGPSPQGKGQTGPDPNQKVSAISGVMDLRQQECGQAAVILTVKNGACLPDDLNF
jgi:hypothetical protein